MLNNNETNEVVSQESLNSDSLTKWIAASGYIFSITDSLLTNVMENYQFYFFGYKVSLITIIPFLIFYYINKDKSPLFVSRHIKKSVQFYVLYIVWSVVNGVFLSSIGSGLVYSVLGTFSLSLVMLIVLVWLCIRSGQGIIKVFSNVDA